MPYEVHLDVYDGPFDLLLQLITAQQVDLYEIPLSRIVDAFVAEIARLELVDLDLATEFLLIAATLVELKCKRLLPGGDDVDLDEELALYEARDYLLARLVEAKMFSAAGRVFAELESDASRAHGRRVGADERFAEVVPDLLAGVTAEQLARLAFRALGERPVPIVEIAHIHEDEVSVGESMQRLLEELPRLRHTTLRALTKETTSTAAFVACFLALLELYKQALVDLDQATTFGELTVSWTGGDDAVLVDPDEYDGTVGGGRGGDARA